MPAGPPGPAGRSRSRPGTACRGETGTCRPPASVEVDELVGEQEDVGEVAQAVLARAGQELAGDLHLRRRGWTRIEQEVGPAETRLTLGGLACQALGELAGEELDGLVVEQQESLRGDGAGAALLLRGI